MDSKKTLKEELIPILLKFVCLVEMSPLFMSVALI